MDDGVGHSDVGFRKVVHRARKNADERDEEDDFGEARGSREVLVPEFPVGKGDDGIRKNPDSLEYEHLRAVLDAVRGSVFFDSIVERREFRIER